MNKTLYDLENDTNETFKINEYDRTQDNSIGQTLKNAREKLGFSLEDVAQKTYIKTHYLHALEEDRFEMLPAYVYTVGYIRTYARLLNIDAAQLVNTYQQKIDNNKEYTIIKDSVSYLTTPKILDEMEQPVIHENLYSTVNAGVNENYQENFRPVINAPDFRDTPKSYPTIKNINMNNLNSPSLHVERHLEAPVPKNLPAELETMYTANIQQAEEIINSAQQDARRLRQGAEQYADYLLAQLEQEIMNTLTIVKNGKAYLKSKPPVIRM